MNPDCAHVEARPQHPATDQHRLAPALDVAMLCVEGDNHPSLSYEIMSSLAVAGINLRGLAVSCTAQHFTAYLAFDDADIATLAVQVLAALEV